MRIYSMTATFGKLDHETITLQPGLNAIYAPNEWGKSTWCAFLIAMLYGMDTRAKTTKYTLADKERFAPWSGSPMSGRIELNWNGRDITIERSTHGRTPLGFFRAYDTQSGLDIPDLTAANCGQMLLGVEQSVFRRAGFIRFSDLPVTEDDALRSRLNGLVSTGDESGDQLRLDKELKNLKNRIRYNRTGLIPQAEAERDSLTRKLRELEDLAGEQKKLNAELNEQVQRQTALLNHTKVLAFKTASEDARKVAEAKSAMESAAIKTAKAEELCKRLPSRQEASEKVKELIHFQEELDHVEAQIVSCPLPPAVPTAPKPFSGLSPEEAAGKVQNDTALYRKLIHSSTLLMMLFSAGMIGAAAWLGITQHNIPASAAALAAFGIGLYFYLVHRSRNAKTAAELEKLYGSANPDNWHRQYLSFLELQQDYQESLRKYHAERTRMDSQLDSLRKQQASLCGDNTVKQMLANWQQVMQAWDTLEAARLDLQQAKMQYETLQGMAHPAPDEMPEHDTLAYSADETERILRSCMASQQNIRMRLGQLQGRMAAIGNPAQMLQQLDAINDRLNQLESTYTALELAQNTLAKASAELQQRFAPRISDRAKQLLSQLTDGRYDRLALGDDFSLRTAAAQEDILHDALWRSDGTIDQLYLALRLAVAEELTPEAPLILDDTLIRFDEDRAKAAIEILKTIAQSKQVILFTCQRRETEYAQ